MAEMVYRNCTRSDIIMSFGINAESVIDKEPSLQDGGAAAIKWLVANTKASDSICADAVSVLTRPNDPWRRDGEIVEITVADSDVKHVVEFGPTPEYKIIRWHVTRVDQNE